MATESIISLRGFARIALALLFSVCLCEGASGQATSPSVVPSTVTALAEPAAWVANGEGAPWDTAVDSHGNVVMADFANAAVYEYPAGGGAPITIYAPGAWAGGGYAVSGIAIDQYDNLYLDNNWSGGLLLIPYDTATNTWNAANAITVANGTSLGYIQTAGLAINSSNTLVIGTENGAPQPALFSMTMDSAGNATNVQTVITLMTARARTASIDNAGNIYLLEDGGLPGIIEVPAGTTGLATDAGLQRVDPTVNGAPLLSHITGAALDAAGNLYVGDSSMGIFMVPNENGTLNPADWVMVSALPAQGQIAVDSADDTIFVPTNSSFSSPSPFVGVTGVANVVVNRANFATTAVGTAGNTVSVNYSFTNSVTPGRFLIQEDGAAMPDFTILTGATTAGTCTTSAVDSEGSCTVNVAMNPLSAGNVSAQLLMQTEQMVNKVPVYTTITSTPLQGTGTGAAISVTPAWESAVGAGLKTPGQVATDAMGDVYVADAGLKEVLMYPAGAGSSTAGVPVGVTLSAPTGVGVDGGGDVFIADSGNIIEVPDTPSGLNAAGQMTLKTGLGPNARLAVDGTGDVYAADPADGRVVELVNAGSSNSGIVGQSEIDMTAGFTAPSSVAVDASGDLYVADGANLIEVSTGGTQTTLLNNLSNVTGLAVDASGSVYIASTGGTVRVPNESGTLNPADETTVAALVTNPTGAALDKSGNLYLADATADDLHFVSINGDLNLGAPALGSVGTADATLLNIGNAALNITDFSASNTDDLVSMSAFSAIGCSTLVSVDATCTMNATMNPGPGEQGTLSSVISIQGNEVNNAVVNAYGTGAALAASTSTITVGSNPGVLNVPITVTVAAMMGSGVPTGTADVYVDGANPTSVSLTNGAGQVTLSPITGGSHVFSVEYVGDRTYGRSTASTTATVTFLTPVMNVPNITAPGYALSQEFGDMPYDNTAAPYEPNYIVQLDTDAGLVPTGTVTFNGNTGSCGVNGAYTLSPVAGTNPGSQAVLTPGCLPITVYTNVPNIVTPQTITSIVYSGDQYFAPLTVEATANGSAITFNMLRNPSVAISATPSTLSVSNGTGSATLSITSVLGYGGVSTNTNYPLVGSGDALNNYTLPLTFSCQGLPAYSTCTFSGGNYIDSNNVAHPDEVNVNTDPSVPVTITVTINTNVPTGTTTSENAHQTPYEFAAMFGVGLFGIVFGRKSRRKGWPMMVALFMLLAGSLASMTACSTKNLSPVTTATTPSGSYKNVIVTAQQAGSIQVTQGGATVTLYGSQNQISLPFTMNVNVQ